MKNINKIERKKYIAPSISVITTAVEQGFGASYGGDGEAGPYFDIEDNGDF